MCASPSPTSHPQQSPPFKECKIHSNETQKPNTQVGTEKQAETATDGVMVHTVTTPKLPSGPPESPEPEHQHTQWLRESTRAQKTKVVKTNSEDSSVPNQKHTGRLHQCSEHLP